MPTISTGRRTWYAALDSRVKYTDVSKKISLLMPDAFPFTSFIAGMKDGRGGALKKKETNNVRFDILTQDPEPSTDAINNGAGYAADATSVVVDNGTYFWIGCYVHVPRTGEVFRVTNVSTNTLTIVRGIGNSGIGETMVDDEPLIILGAPQGDGADLPTKRRVAETESYGYTQIFSDPFGLTRRDQNTSLRGGSDLAFERERVGIEHRLKIERAFLFSKLDAWDDAAGNKVTSTKGLRSYISSINVNVNGSLTEMALENVLADAFLYGSDTKLMFAGATVINAINGFARDKMQTVPKVKSYGVNLQEYISAHGVLWICRHKLMTGTFYSGSAFIVDPNDCWYRFLSNCDTRLYKDVSPQTPHAYDEEYYTDAGLEIRHESKHAFMYGVTG